MIAAISLFGNSSKWYSVIKVLYSGGSLFISWARISVASVLIISNSVFSVDINLLSIVDSISMIGIFTFEDSL